MSEEQIEKELDVEAAEEGVEQELQIIDDEVEVEGASIGSIQAQQVDLRQCAVETMNTSEANIHLGAVAKSTSQSVDVNYGAMGVVKTGDAQMKAAAAGIVLADDGVNMDLSRSHVILTRGNVVMDKSLSVVTGARKVKAENSNIIFLVSGKVEGDVQPLFGPRESLIFGAVAGLVGGILVLMGKLFKGLSKGE